jgi:hypothetical protein
MRLRRSQHSNKGYVLPMTVALGMAMLILGLTAAMFIQTDRSIARQRQQNGMSLSVAEGATDRVMLELSRRDNSLLLSRPYDPINPNTGRNYLGWDGVLNSGDEGTNPIDRWTNHDPSGEPCFVQAGATRPSITLAGTIGSQGSYRLLAYRYHPEKQQGTLLVEGRFKTQTVSTVLITVSVKPDLNNFPGVMAMNNHYGTSEDPLWDTGVVGLRNRVVLGSYANVYYVPDHSPVTSLTGISQPNNGNRSAYLNALFANPAQDGASGQPTQVNGNIFACRLTVLPYNTQPPATPSIGTIATSRTLAGATGTKTVYWVDQINLAGTETLNVDTTAGPVSIYINRDWNGNAITLKDDAQIRNVRTDNQPPRVGDLRIVILQNSAVQLLDRACIRQAFLWIPTDEFQLETTSPGCATGRNTNFEGVVWAQAILSSKNQTTNRNINYLNNQGSGTSYETNITGANNSGIYVPDDLSSLDDMLAYVDLPVRYWIAGVVRWQQVRL